jgi:hypothetical protein
MHFAMKLFLQRREASCQIVHFVSDHHRRELPNDNKGPLGRATWTKWSKREHWDHWEH